MLSIGVLVQNRYTIVEKLGSGGFGEVFLVRDEKSSYIGHKSKAFKALKVLKLDQFPPPEKAKAIALFQREAKVLSRLNHPGIPKVEPQGYFTIEHNQQTLHCLVMEKISGENLLEWLKNPHHQRISSALAIDWLKQLLDIVQYLHENHYFHRDIKPENIICQPNGKLVLIDFGGVQQINNNYLANLAEDRENTVLISQQGYTPIEQINGKAVPQSDLFALGRTMVHLLTGVAPINLPENETTGELIWRDRAGEVPAPLADLIDEMMALFPGQRPVCAQLILQRLNDLASLGSFKSNQAGQARGFYQRIQSKIIKSPRAIAWVICGSILLIFTRNLVANRIAVKMNQLGISYHRNKQFDTAKQYYKLAIFFQSNYGQAYYNLGSLYEDQNDIQSAIINYDKGMKYHNAAAYNNRGRIALLAGDCQAAVGLFLDGLKVATENPVKYTLLTNLGRGQLCLKAYQKAQASLEKAIAISSDRPEAYCILARVMYDLGADVSAKKALVKCPVNSINLPELNNWLKEKGHQTILER